MTKIQKERKFKYIYFLYEVHTGILDSNSGDTKNLP